MKKIAFLLLLSFITVNLWSQDDKNISGTVLNDATDEPLQNVHIVNLNKVVGTLTKKPSWRVTLLKPSAIAEFNNNL